MNELEERYYDLCEKYGALAATVRYAYRHVSPDGAKGIKRGLGDDFEAVLEAGLGKVARERADTAVGDGGGAHGAG